MLDLLKSQTPFAPIHWGATSGRERGPVCVRLDQEFPPTAIGVYGGPYGTYAALGEVTGLLSRDHRPNLEFTEAKDIVVPPNSNWFDAHKIVAMDPWGHLPGDLFAEERAQGIDIRPTISMTTTRLHLPDIKLAIKRGDLKPDRRVLSKSGYVNATKISIDPVWHLPSLANRLKLTEEKLREGLVLGTNGMYGRLITCPDIKVYLPPIGGTSLYIFGDVNNISSPHMHITGRVHDECNGSDTFGADICTCRPFLMHGLIEGIRTAIEDGVGFIMLNRKEGRGLGEIPKLRVYNSRENQGDVKEHYFNRTIAVAGVPDLRFQELMPDPLLWLGIARIDDFISESPHKLKAIAEAGIEIGRQVELPDHMIPDHARVEINAKRDNGYGELCRSNTPPGSHRDKPMDVHA